MFIPCEDCTANTAEIEHRMGAPGHACFQGQVK